MKALITWFAKNSVAANLSMALILVSGYLILPLFEREIVPPIVFDVIEIIVALPGAGPTQVERVVSRKIEQALVGIDGILEIATEARKNISVTHIEVSNKFSMDEVVNKVRTRVDAIRGFPEEASRPIVGDLSVRESGVALALYGDTSLYSLNILAEMLVAQMRSIAGVSLVFIPDPPSREFLVEVSEDNLQRYQIQFSEISRKIQAAVVDMVGATLVTEEGEIAIIGEANIKSSIDLEELAVRSMADGARISLSDIASVQDNYQVIDSHKKMNGKSVVYIAVNRGQHEDLLKLANSINRFVLDARRQLPDGVSLEIIADTSKHVSSRIELLSANAIGGFLLVLIVLLLFMNLRLSFWTSLGIPISFLGAFSVLYFAGGSLNMVSLFGFILVLGIVVDDAIIVGESVYSRHEEGLYGVEGAIAGALDVYRPVVFAILTTMIAFAPMLFMPGEEGRLIFWVPVVVISVLAFSLFESLFILPAHLSSIKNKKIEIVPVLNKWQSFFSARMDAFIQSKYKPLLEHALHWRYATCVFFLVVFILSASLLAFRWVNVSLVSHIESDILTAHLEMIEDTPALETRDALWQLEAAAEKIRKEVNERLGFEQIVHVSSSLASRMSSRGQVSIYLDTDEKRVVSGDEIENRLLALFGDVPHVKSIRVRTSVVGEGVHIDLELAHHDSASLEQASQELKSVLGSYKGVRNVWDNMRQGGREVAFSLKPEANDMGVSTAQVSAQIRQAFHGEVVQIYDENSNRIPVKIEYPESQRNSLWFLENLPIRLSDDSTVPLYNVAELDYRDAPSTINLSNGKRTISVRARLTDEVSEAQIMTAVRRDYLNNLESSHPGMTWRIAGGQRRSHQVLDYLAIAYPLSLLVMYLLMATLFASYTQPLMVMFAIPFGIVGALIGHLVMNVEFALWSLMGIIAVSGVVVNDNLVLIDRINRRRVEGFPLLDAIREAGVARFRPITLTSITTFLGLAPLMFEKSMQAQFLIPMAVSMAFGVMFATIISLILVPVLYNILDDLQGLVEKKNFGGRFNQYLRQILNNPS